MRYRVVVGFITVLLAFTADVRGQDVLAHAKDLYLSAAYDEALVLLEQLRAQPPREAATEVAQYRVFCLLALERRDEARKAIEDIVTADPFYRPSETQTSPRVRAVFQETRKALLPALLQRTYADAKASFERKDPRAVSQFEQVLTLIDDPDLKGVAQVADLRTVATGFRDLSKAMGGVPTPQTPPKPADPPAATTQTTSSAAVNTAPAQPVSPATGSDDVSRLSPPVVISQPLPRWIPPQSIDARAGFKGLIEVTIDENGTVTSARLKQSVHPLYDDKLLAMARTWKYKPAMRDGVPAPSVKIVQIHLQPPR
jgi:TonB family protein